MGQPRPPRPPLPRRRPPCWFRRRSAPRSRLPPAPAAPLPPSVVQRPRPALRLIPHFLLLSPVPFDILPCSFARARNALRRADLSPARDQLRLRGCLSQPERRLLIRGLVAKQDRGPGERRP